MTESCPPLPQVRPLLTKVFRFHRVIFYRAFTFFGFWVCGIKGLAPDFSLMDVVEEIEIVVEEI